MTTRTIKRKMDIIEKDIKRFTKSAKEELEYIKELFKTMVKNDMDRCDDVDNELFRKLQGFQKYKYEINILENEHSRLYWLIDGKKSPNDVKEKLECFIREAEKIINEYRQWMKYPNSKRFKEIEKESEFILWRIEQSLFTMNGNTNGWTFEKAIGDGTYIIKVRFDKPTGYVFKEFGLNIQI